MARRARRVPLSASAVAMLRRLQAAGGRVAGPEALVVDQRGWGVLATLRGRMLVRWDEGGRNIRLTAYGREFLAHR